MRLMKRPQDVTNWRAPLKREAPVNLIYCSHRNLQMLSHADLVYARFRKKVLSCSTRRRESHPMLYALLQVALLLLEQGKFTWGRIKRARYAGELRSALRLKRARLRPAFGSL